MGVNTVLSRVREQNVDDFCIQEKITSDIEDGNFGVPCNISS